MVLKAVLMKSGLVSINTARQVNTAHSKTIVNAARPMSYLSKTAHSTIKRPIHKNTTFKNSNINQRVNTVRGEKFNTARPKAVVNVGNPQIDLQDQGVIDSGCSRHMTGNMFYLTDYEKIDGGYVAFGGNPKGGKITGKGTQSNGITITKASDNAGQARKETEPVKDYILLLLWTTDPPFSQNPKSSQDDRSKPSIDDEKKVDEDPIKDSECNDQEKEDNVNSTNNVNAASTNEVNVVGGKTSIELPFDPNMPALEDYSIFDYSNNDEDDGAEADMNNLDTTIQVSPIPTTRIHKDHPLDQVIGDLQSSTQTRRMSKNLEEHGFVSTIQQRTNHKDLQNCLFACFLSQEEPKKIKEEVYVCQPPRFEDPDVHDRVYKVEKALNGLHQTPRAWYKTLSTYLLDNEFQRGKIDKTFFIKRYKCDILLVQVYVDDIIFGSTKKELCNAFEKLMHEKFQMSSKGELIFFLGLQLEQKKDGIFISQDKYVGEILKKFRSMIGSLMYLISSRPNIMFTMCSSARYQVNPKVSHLHAIKIIFSARSRQWLKIPQQKLNIWLLQVAVDKCFGFRINYLIMGKAKKNVRLMMEELCKNRQSDLVRKRIERSGELKNRKRVEYIKNRQSVWNGIGVNIDDLKLMLLGINLLLLVKVNATRHKLTTAGKS
ncbi:uncharacterized mitochondrial protein-like protein [Tanacetum coccineum]